jgi:hypothetical protein
MSWPPVHAVFRRANSRAPQVRESFIPRQAISSSVEHSGVTQGFARIPTEAGHRSSFAIRLLRMHAD